MKVVALVSGGKDSAYNMLHCALLGHEIVALANLYPPPTHGSDEMDSFMYQTVGSSAIEFYSQCMDGIPVYRQPITGTSLITSLEYQYDEKSHNESIPIDSEKPLEEQATPRHNRDETEDLYLLLRKVQKAHPDIEGVSVGAILSTYQRVRVENVCQRLGLVSLAFLWERSQAELLDEIINSGVDARIIKTAAYGLGKEQLMQSLAQVKPKLAALNAQFGLHLCGEGGEYETLVFDSPLFKRKLVSTSSKIVEHSAGDSVYFVHFDKFSTEEKPGYDPKDLESWKDKVAIPQPLDSTYEEVLNQIRVDDEYYKPKNEAMNNRLLNSRELEEHRKRDLTSGSDSSAGGFYEPDRTMHIKPRIIVNKKLKTVWISNVTAPPLASDYPVERVTELVLEQVKNLLANIEVEDDEDEDETLLSSLNNVSLDGIKKRTKKVHLTTANVMYVHAFLKSMDDFSEFNKVYADFFAKTGRPNPPARYCVENGSLVHNSRVQLTLVATLDSDPIPGKLEPQDTLSHRKGLHVQSRSYWAPANIGPYSQAISSDADGLVYLAGQIPLIPPTMTLLETQAVEIHSVLSLQHINRVAASQGATCYAGLVAYVTSIEAGDAVARTWPGYLSVTSWAGADEDSVKDVDYYGHRVDVPLFIVQVSGLPRGAQVEWAGLGIVGKILDYEKQKFDEIDSDDEEEFEQIVEEATEEEEGIESRDGDDESSKDLEDDEEEVEVIVAETCTKPKPFHVHPYDSYLFKPHYEKRHFVTPEQHLEFNYQVARFGHQALVMFTADSELSRADFDAVISDVFNDAKYDAVASHMLYKSKNAAANNNNNNTHKVSLVSGTIFYTGQLLGPNGTPTAPENFHLLEEVRVDCVTLLDRKGTYKPIGYMLRLVI